MHGPGGAWSQGGAWSGGCLLPGVPGPGGVSFPGGAWSRGCLLPGGGIPACTEAHTPQGETATAADGMHPTGMHSCRMKKGPITNILVCAFV